ncbi:PAS domain S-box [Caulobacter sp. AP07]|uniref:HWE histidine kinase domain-containing protein n=1 Tax=Caulobacter sp. AP07 TaxID=1144304 RepID=UPI000271FCE0|nr:HWE histidine kinase domain-containing protein [Caulobacter sp. AP07]EJL27599.1 PAS domain S-box [Caulobacter sp. AP07]
MTNPELPPASGPVESPAEAGANRTVFSATMADAVPILIGYLDRQERYRFVNRAYEDWFGVARADIEGRTLIEVMGEAGYARVKHHVARALGGERLTFEGEVPYRGAGLRHIEAQYVPDIAAGGVVLGYYVLVSDISDRKRAEAEVARLLERERRRALMLDLARRLREEPDPDIILVKACEALGVQLGAAQVGYGVLDPSATYVEIVGEWVQAGAPSLMGSRHVLDDFGLDMADQMRAGQQMVIRDVDADPRTTQAAAIGAYAPLDVRAFVAFPLVKAGRLTVYLYVAQNTARDWTVEDVAFIGEVADLTWTASERARADAALRRAEETERLLIREIDHRAKNVLAVVQSLAQLTPFVDKKQYVTALSGRIGSLARSHSLLSGSRWSGARLDVLLHQELEPYGAESDSRLMIGGPPVLIQAEAAQSLGLVIHELATNASKYGALSTGAGMLEVDWHWEPDRRLVLTWRETGGPPTAPPKRQGFGATLIANAGRQVGARIEHDWLAEGLVCRIALDRGATPYFGNPPRTQAADALTGDETRALRGQRVLVVEDEALVAMELAQILTAAGAEVIGPVGDVEDALALVEAGGIDRALLDVNLAGRLVTPVASALSRRSIPFIYLTGYQEPDVDSGLVLRKPANAATLLGALANQVAAAL